MSTDPGFLGTGWAFPPAFDGRTQGAVMVDGAADVRESLRILLSTTPGERILHPTYGCGLRRMVFEQINSSAITEIRSLIEKAVLFFEPRITLEHTHIELDDLLEGVLRIRLEYCICSTNSRDNLVFPLYLQPGEGPHLFEDATP